MAGDSTSWSPTEACEIVGLSATALCPRRDTRRMNRKDVGRLGIRCSRDLVIVTNVFVSHTSPTMPLELLPPAASVAWARRDRLRVF